MGLFSFLKKEKTPVQQLTDLLKLQLKEAIFNNDWKRRQEIALKLLWLDCIKNEENILKEVFGRFYFEGLSKKLSNADVEVIAFPENLDSKNLIHLKFSGIIIHDLGVVIEEGGKWKNCVYKPDAILPYPKEYLNYVLEFALLKAEQDNASKEKIKLLKGGKFLLNENFLSIPPEEVPTDLMGNMTFGTSLK